MFLMIRWLRWASRIQLSITWWLLYWSLPVTAISNNYLQQAPLRPDWNPGVLGWRCVSFFSTSVCICRLSSVSVLSVPRVAGACQSGTAFHLQPVCWPAQGLGPYFLDYHCFSFLRYQPLASIPKASLSSDLCIHRGSLNQEAMEPYGMEPWDSNAGLHLPEFALQLEKCWTLSWVKEEERTALSVLVDFFNLLFLFQ